MSTALRASRFTSGATTHPVHEYGYAIAPFLHLRPRASRTSQALFITRFVNAWGSKRYLTLMLQVLRYPFPYTILEGRTKPEKRRARRNEGRADYTSFILLLTRPSPARPGLSPLFVVWTSTSVAALLRLAPAAFVAEIHLLVRLPSQVSTFSAHVPLAISREVAADGCKLTLSFWGDVCQPSSLRYLHRPQSPASEKEHQQNLLAVRVAITATANEHRPLSFESGSSRLLFYERVRDTTPSSPHLPHPLEMPLLAGLSPLKFKLDTRSARSKGTRASPETRYYGYPAHIGIGQPSMSLVPLEFWHCVSLLISRSSTIALPLTEISSIHFSNILHFSKRFTGIARVDTLKPMFQDCLAGCPQHSAQRPRASRA
ncbi:hypothetical protein B0H19DRAFT_1277086 [Mycena capillaripes]|nr:hypothetical protein B0H19DRAFT_1277086 [Mycena capillaripes]